MYVEVLYIYIQPAHIRMLSTVASDVQKIQYKWWGQVVNSAWGEAEYYIWHEILPWGTVFLYTSRVNSALTDLLFCIGKISSSRSNGAGMWSVLANRGNG